MTRTISVLSGLAVAAMLSVAALPAAGGDGRADIIVGAGGPDTMNKAAVGKRQIRSGAGRSTVAKGP